MQVKPSVTYFTLNSLDDRSIFAIMGSNGNSAIFRPVKSVSRPDVSIAIKVHTRVK